MQSSRLHKSLALFSALFTLSSVLALASGPAGEPAGGSRAVIKNIPPRYPELARRMHVSGVVVLRVLVQPNGTVAETHVQSGHPLLSSAATEAVSQWRFAAALEPTFVNINVQFAAQ